MWAEAARHVARFREGVLNARDAAGYPLSVRQTALRYDPVTGAMPVVLPAALGAVEGPASLLCHFHDDKLWSLRAVLVRGRVERRGDAWWFVSTGFTPPSNWQMLKNMRRAVRSYLDERGLPTPRVDFGVIAALWRAAREVRDP